MLNNAESMGDTLIYYILQTFVAWELPLAGGIMETINHAVVGSSGADRSPLFVLCVCVLCVWWAWICSSVESMPLWVSAAMLSGSRKVTCLTMAVTAVWLLAPMSARQIMNHVGLQCPLHRCYCTCLSHFFFRKGCMNSSHLQYCSRSLGRTRRNA